MSGMKDPKGGLTAEGRKKMGGNLKPGVKNYSDASTSDKKRWISWALRFYGQDNYPPLVDDKGEPTRFALTAAAWGEPVPKTEASARAIAAKARNRQKELDGSVSKTGTITKESHAYSFAKVRSHERTSFILLEGNVTKGQRAEGEGSTDGGVVLEQPEYALAKINTHHDRRGRFAPVDTRAPGVTQDAKPERDMYLSARARAGAFEPKGAGGERKGFAEDLYVDTRLIAGVSISSGTKAVQANKQAIVVSTTKALAKDPDIIAWADRVLELARRGGKSAHFDEESYSAESEVRRTTMLLHPPTLIALGIAPRGLVQSAGKRGLAAKMVAGSQDARTALIAGKVQETINGWANSSTSDTSIAVMHGVSTALKGVVPTTTSKSTGIDRYELESGAEKYNAAPEFYNAFARHTYSETQAALKKLGISEVYLYRGFGTKGGTMKPGVGKSVMSRSLSSWSTSPGVATGFAEPMQHDHIGYVVQASMHASRVFSSPVLKTGLGCLREQEFVVLGRSKPDTVRAFKLVQDGWSDSPLITKARAYEFTIDLDDRDNADWIQTLDKKAELAKINTHHDKRGLFASGGGATHPNTHMIVSHTTTNDFGKRTVHIGLKSHETKGVNHHSSHDVPHGTDAVPPSAIKAVKALQRKGYKTAGQYRPASDTVQHEAPTATKSKGTAKTRQHEVNRLNEAQKVEYERAPAHYNHDQAMIHAITTAAMKSRKRSKQIKKYGVAVPTARSEYGKPKQRFVIFRKFNPHHSRSNGEFTSGGGGAGAGRGVKREGTGAAYAGGGGGKPNSLPPAGQRSWSGKSEADKNKEIKGLTPAEGRRYANAPASFDHEQAMWHAKVPNGGTPRKLVKNDKGRMMPEKKEHQATAAKPTDGNGKPLNAKEMAEYKSLDKNSQNAYLGMANNRMRAYTHAQMISNVTQPHTRKGFHEITDAERKELSGPRGKDGKPVKGENGKAKGNSVTGAAVPPGWARVLINDNWRDSKQGLIVEGIAANGKKQPQYSLAHHERKGVEKFNRVMEMGKSMPTLDKALAKYAGKGNDQADVVLLIRTQGLRPDRGSGSGSQKAYGATSLEARHVVSIKGDVTHLKFQAKDGVLVDLQIKDKAVANMLRSRTATRKGTTPLFGDISSTAGSPKSLEHFMRTEGGMGKNIKVKDLRTYIGTSIAHAEVQRLIKARKAPKTPAELEVVRGEIAKHVAAQLGNKPDQAQKSYINQGVYLAFKIGA